MKPLSLHGRKVCSEWLEFKNDIQSRNIFRSTNGRIPQAEYEKKYFKNQKMANKLMDY